MEEEGTLGGGGGGGSGSTGKNYLVVNPGGTKINPIPTTGFSTPTIQIQPSNTILPTRFNSPTPTPTNTPTPSPNVDLVIQSITRSSSGYRFNICNQGTGTNYMPGLWYYIYVYGTPEWSWDRYDWDPPVLGPGQCTATTFACERLSWYNDYECTAAITVTGSIDHGQQVSEYNESNNIRSQSFPAATATPTPTPGPNPDLVIEDITRSTTQLTYRVCNRGTANGTGQSFPLYAQPAYTTVYGTVPTMNQCTNVVSSCSTWCGSYNYTASGWVDYDYPPSWGGYSSITETNENNNYYEKAFVAFTPTPTPKGASVLTTWNSGYETNGSLSDIALNTAQTRVYVTDTSYNKIDYHSTSGTYQGEFTTPSGNYGPESIFQYNSTNAIMVQYCKAHNMIVEGAGAGTIQNSWGSCSDAFAYGTYSAFNNQVYLSGDYHPVNNPTGNYIRRTNTSGSLIGSFTGHAIRMHIDSSGNVWGIGYYLGKVYKWSATGTLLGEWDVHNPTDVHVVGSYVYLATMDHIERRSLDMSTVYNRYTWGGGSQMGGAPAIVADNAGIVYVADGVNRRVIKLQFAN